MTIALINTQNEMELFLRGEKNNKKTEKNTPKNKQNNWEIKMTKRYNNVFFTTCVHLNCPPVSDLT
jgi:hypothetical protein